jgi:hypothetical protein
MDSLSLLEWTFAISSSFVAIAGSIWASLSYLKRPRFIIGAPPDFQEQKAKKITPNKVGRQSLINQFKHNSVCMAVKVKDKTEISENDYKRIFSNKFRTRDINMSPDGKVSLYIVTENIGGRAARDYRLAVEILSPKVHVKNILPESLEIGAFYSNRPDLVENKDLKCVNKRIVKAYDNYMDIGDDYGDMLFLEGDLESGMYELIILDLFIESRLDCFIIVFAIDCSDFWLSKAPFIQGFKVNRTKLS